MSIDLKKSSSGKKKVWQRLLSGLSLLICGLAIAAVFRGLQGTDWRLVWADVNEISPLKLPLALLFVVCSYGAIACYDLLAFQYIERKLAVSKIIFAGLITYSISPNVGFAFLSGGVLRYRIYRQWQVSNLDIAKIIAFTNFNLWVGLIPITGSVFVATEFSLPEAIAQSFTLLSPPELGILLLIISGLYLIFTYYKKEPFKIKQKEIQLPSLELTFQQVLVFALDWGFAAGALYFLLGNPYNFPFFFGIYVIAMVAGLISTLPGGLGVFETVILFFLESLQPKEEILATLIVFRCLYYFLPFTIAAIALLNFEVRQRLS